MALSAFPTQSKILFIVTTVAKTKRVGGVSGSQPFNRMIFLISPQPPGIRSRVAILIATVPFIAGSLTENGTAFVQCLHKIAIPSCLKFRSLTAFWVKCRDQGGISHRRVRPNSFMPPTLAQKTVTKMYVIHEMKPRLFRQSLSTGSLDPPASDTQDFASVGKQS